MAIFRCNRCSTINRVADERVGQRPICGQCKAALDPSGAPQEVSADTFERAIAGSPVPVLVDFWAPWCAPCRMAAPVVADLAKRSAGKMLVLKMNVDDNQAMAAKHAVQGIPAFVLYHGGREVGRRTGLASRADMESWIAQTMRAAA
ncbi:Thioredoxin [Minicystis rosea]|nr:Thioredoxin [Minicystis rosea]